MSDPEKTQARIDDHVVPTLNARDMESNVLIGVCGVQAAGKTVFLTSIFQTMTGEDVEGIGHVSFDREDKGGALYFERIENEIREQGRITPTREPAVARLLVEPLASHPQDEVGVVLFDFAGRYFTEFSDLPRARAAAETPQERTELDLVNRYLQRCNGFIVLVDSTNFGHDEVAGRNIPFPASISFLLTHCRRKGIPLALVFTKKDQNPSLSTEDVANFEMVRKFRSTFRDDHVNNQPYGVVEHLSCYELDETDDVLEQSKDGSIWRREPSRVFIKILRAVWPKVLEKRRSEQEARERDRLRKELAERQAKHWKRLLIAAGLVLLLAIALTYASCRNQHRLQQAVSVVDRVAANVDQGHPDRIAEADLETLGQVKSQREVEGVAAAWSSLAKALRESYSSVAATYPLGGNETAATRTLLELGRILDIPVDTATQSLQARLRFLESNVPEDQLERRLAVIGQSLRDAERLGDQAFREALDGQASRLREQISSAETQPGYSLSNVTDRARFVRAGLRKLDGGDRELAVLTRAAMGRLLGSSLAELGERQHLTGFLSSALPALSLLLSDPQLPAKHAVEYRVVRGEVAKVRRLDELRTLRSRVESLIAEMAVRDEAEQVLLTATLEDLFRGLDVRDRRRIWAALLAGAEAEYLFELRPDAWPTDLRPWIKNLRADLADDKNFAAASWHAVQDIGRHTLYWAEVHDIADLTTFRYLDLETVHCYREVINHLERGYSSQTASEKLHALDSLTQSAQAEHENVFKTTTPTFEVRRREIVALANQAAAAGQQYSARSRLVGDLTDDLKRICATYLDSSTDGCSS